MFEIDPTNQYPHVAETIAALVLMNMEAESRNVFIEDEVLRFSEELTNL